MKLTGICCVALAAALSVFSCACKKEPSAPASQWTNLLDDSLARWDKFIGVPYYDVDLPGYPKGDGMNGTPIGLNNDPLLVFKVERQDNAPVLHISGQIYGGLSTKEPYGDYHFKTEFKWGERKYAPRLNAKHDNGILYHTYGAHGWFWNVWMASQEFQVQEGDMGDYFALGPAIDIRATYKTADGETDWIYDTAAPAIHFGHGAPAGRVRRGANNEKAHGEWNTLELICLGSKSMHIVNGKVVMVLENSRVRTDTSGFVPLTAGKIQIQSEGAEAWYRNMQIRQITEIPAEYR
ncbi:MAG: DUF1080 domain-containing protein [Bacteroidota bacterium]